MAKMRTTTRGGRQGKAKHNDRTYLPEEERPRENRYSYVGQKNAPNLTFREAELRYYEKRYSEGLEARMSVTRGKDTRNVAKQLRTSTKAIKRVLRRRFSKLVT